MEYHAIWFLPFLYCLLLKSELKYIQDNLKKKDRVFCHWQLPYMLPVICHYPYPFTLCHTWKGSSHQDDSIVVKPRDMFEQLSLQGGYEIFCICLCLNHQHKHRLYQNKSHPTRRKCRLRGRGFFPQFTGGHVYDDADKASKLYAKRFCCVWLKVDSWGNQDSPLGCIETAELWNKHTTWNH